MAVAGTLSSMSRLQRVLVGGEFAVTAEITPPVAGAAEPLLAMAAPLKGRVDGVNVTDGPRARVHMSAMAAAAILLADGIEPVLQVTCRDRNRIALQADLLGASALGIRNVLLMTGDKPGEGEGGEPAAKAVFDMQSAELSAVAAAMRDRGMLPSGRAITPPPNLFIGAAEMPVEPKEGWTPARTTEKVTSGAQFLQTQLCYDIGLVRRWAARLVDAGLTERAGVLLGTGPIGSARSARWMRENLWGVVVPDAVIDRLEKAADPVAEGVRMCADIVAELREIPGIAGVHLMAPGNAGALPALLDACGRSGEGPG